MPKGLGKSNHVPAFTAPISICKVRVCQSWSDSGWGMRAMVTTAGGYNDLMCEHVVFPPNARDKLVESLYTVTLM